MSDVAILSALYDSAANQSSAGVEIKVVVATTARGHLSRLLKSDPELEATFTIIPSPVNPAGALWVFKRSLIDAA